MEGYCRVAFPEEYPPGKMLGEFRREEQGRQEQGVGLFDSHDFGELGDITEYASKFRHATNPNYERDLRNIDGNQLKSFVDRVMQFTRGRQTGRPGASS